MMSNEDSMDLYADLFEGATSPGRSLSQTAHVDSVADCTSSTPVEDVLTREDNSIVAVVEHGKCSLQTALRALEEADNENNGDEGAESEGQAKMAKDLMEDVYSLHTEKDIQHSKELQAKQSEVDQLKKSCDILAEENKQLRHNIALLLATAKKEIASQKKMVMTLRKQLVSQPPVPLHPPQPPWPAHTVSYSHPPPADSSGWKPQDCSFSVKRGYDNNTTSGCHGFLHTPDHTETSRHQPTKTDDKQRRLGRSRDVEPSFKRTERARTHKLPHKSPNKLYQESPYKSYQKSPNKLHQTPRWHQKLSHKRCRTSTSGEKRRKKRLVDKTKDIQNGDMGELLRLKADLLNELGDRSGDTQVDDEMNVDCEETTSLHIATDGSTLADALSTSTSGTCVKAVEMSPPRQISADCSGNSHRPSESSDVVVESALPVAGQPLSLDKLSGWKIPKKAKSSNTSGDGKDNVITATSDNNLMDETTTLAKESNEQSISSKFSDSLVKHVKGNHEHEQTTPTVTATRQSKSARLSAVIPLEAGDNEVVDPRDKERPLMAVPHLSLVHWSTGSLLYSGGSEKQLEIISRCNSQESCVSDNHKGDDSAGDLQASNDDLKDCEVENFTHVRKNCFVGNSTSHVKDSSSHVKDSSSHVKDSSSHVKDSSSRIKDSSSHVKDSSSHVKDSSSHVKDSSSHVKDSSSHVKDSSSHVKDSSSRIKDSSSHVKDSSSHVKDSSSHVKDSSSHVKDSSPHVKDSSSHVKDSSSHVKDSSSHVKDSSSQVKENSSQIQDSSSHVKDSSSHVKDSSSYVKDGSSHVKDSAPRVKDSSSHVKDSSSCVKDSSTHVKGSSSQVNDSSSQVKDSSSRVKDSSSQVKDSSSRVKDSSSHVKDSFSQVKDNSSHVRDSSSQIKDSSSRVKDNSSHVKYSSSNSPAAEVNKSEVCEVITELVEKVVESVTAGKLSEIEPDKDRECTMFTPVTSVLGICQLSASKSFKIPQRKSTDAKELPKDGGNVPPLPSLVSNPYNVPPRSKAQLKLELIFSKGNEGGSTTHAVESSTSECNKSVSRNNVISNNEYCDRKSKGDGLKRRPKLDHHSSSDSRRNSCRDEKLRDREAVEYSRRPYHSDFKRKHQPSTNHKRTDNPSTISKHSSNQHSSNSSAHSQPLTEMSVNNHGSKANHSSNRRPQRQSLPRSADRSPVRRDKISHRQRLVECRKAERKRSGQGHSESPNKIGRDSYSRDGALFNRRSDSKQRRSRARNLNSSSKSELSHSQYRKSVQDQSWLTTKSSDGLVVEVKERSEVKDERSADVVRRDGVSTDGTQRQTTPSHQLLQGDVSDVQAVDPGEASVKVGPSGDAAAESNSKDVDLEDGEIVSDDEPPPGAQSKPSGTTPTHRKPKRLAKSRSTTDRKERHRRAKLLSPSRPRRH